MNTFTVSLPTLLKSFLESEAAAEGHEGPSAYLEAMLQRKQRRKEIEAELLAELEEIEQRKGIPVTPEYWARMRADFRQRRGLRVALKVLPKS